MFAVLDILRCAVEKGRRTVFDLEGLPGCLRASSTSQPEGKSSDEADNNWQVIQWSGFPLELILCIAATVNLDCDRSVMTPEAVRAVADKIEEGIKTWNPARSQAAGYEDSLTYLQEAATKEMVRRLSLPVRRLGRADIRTFSSSGATQRSFTFIASSVNLAASRARSKTRSTRFCT